MSILLKTIILFQNIIYCDSISSTFFNLHGMKQIGIIGPNKSICSEELYNFGVQLGQQIAGEDNVIICGGRGGFMEAVCKGAKSSIHTFNGQTIGVLPSDTPEKANPFVDVVIPTGMGIARNMIIINAADIIIAAGGGAGTLSEIAFAWQKRKTVLCLTTFGGWSKQLANTSLDARARGLLVPVSSIHQILEYIENGKSVNVS